MWRLPPVQNECITITLFPTFIALGWLGPTKKNPITLKAYKKIDVTISRPKSIRPYLQDFIHYNKLEHSFVALSLSTPAIYETFTSLATTISQARDIYAENNKANNSLQHYFLHSNHNGTHTFYVYTVPLGLIAQYQILLHTLELQPSIITSSYLALIECYKKIFGAAYRQSQMAVDMLSHHYKLENAIQQSLINRLVFIPSEYKNEVEKLSLLTMLGLYYQKEK